MGSGKSKIFGLIVPDISNPFFPAIVQEFESIAVRHQYEILLTSTLHDSMLMEKSVRRMIERRVDGLAVMTFGMESLLEDLNSRRVPLVFVDVGPSRPRVSNIRDAGHGAPRVQLPNGHRINRDSADSLLVRPGSGGTSEQVEIVTPPARLLCTELSQHRHYPD
jgi:hypothetical protein